MEYGPPTNTAEELIDAIKTREGRWICIRAFKTLARIKGKDILIVTGGKNQQYSLHTWVKGHGETRTKDKDIAVLILNKQHYRLLLRSEQGWPEELKKAKESAAQGERAGMKEEGDTEHETQEEATDEGTTEEWKRRKEQEERRTQKAASVFSKCKTLSEIELHLSEAMGEIEEWRETIIEEYQSAFLAMQIQDGCGNRWEKKPTTKERQWPPRVRSPERDAEEGEQAASASDDPVPRSKEKKTRTNNNGPPTRTETKSRKETMGVEPRRP